MFVFLTGEKNIYDRNVKMFDKFGYVKMGN